MSRKRKYKHNPNFVIPLTSQEIGEIKSDIMESILEDDLKRFLRKYYKRQKNIFVYSRIIPQLQEKRVSRRAVEWLLNNFTYPSHVRAIIHIFLTLRDDFQYKGNIHLMKSAVEIWHYFEDYEIDGYIRGKWQQLVDLKGRGMIKADIYHNANGKKCFKEQKAIGFIPKKDFKDFDKKAGHIYSNYNRKYLYPKNFYFSNKTRENYDLNVYIANSLYGVPGWTRAEVPIKARK